MTVLCFLRLSESGEDEAPTILAAADRMFSYGDRAAKYENKIFSVGERYLFGFAGDLAIRDCLVKRLRKEVGPQDALTEVLDKTKAMYIKERDRRFDDLLVREGYTREDWQNWREERIEPRIRTELHEKLKDPRLIDAAVLVAGYNKVTGVFEIHQIDPPGISRDTGYFAVIGPQSSYLSIESAAKGILKQTQNIEPIDGGKISVEEGTRINLSGVREGWPERGVGGKTQLVVLTGNQRIRGYSQEKTTYMHNLLELERQGKLDRDHVSDSIIRVVNGKESFEAIVEETTMRLLGSDIGKRAKRYLKHQLTKNILLDEFL